MPTKRQVNRYINRRARRHDRSRAGQKSLGCSCLPSFWLLALVVVVLLLFL